MRTSIAGIEINGYVNNASGCHDTTLKELQELSTVSNFVTLKSTTADPRIGNPEPRFAKLSNGSTIQRMGLPNIGLDETLKNIDVIARPGLVIKASIAGLDLNENIKLISAFRHNPVDMIEINASCPNTGNEILAYNLIKLDYHLQVLSYASNDKPIGIKLPAYNSIEQQSRVVEMVVKHGLKFVTAINSISGLAIDVFTERAVLSGNGVGGVGGGCIFTQALLECWRYHQLLKGTGIALIGVGGVSTGSHAFSMMLAGCDSVEIGSALHENGVGALKSANAELDELMALKKYTDVKHVKGKLRFE